MMYNYKQQFLFLKYKKLTERPNWASRMVVDRVPYHFLYKVEKVFRVFDREYCFTCLKSMKKKS